MHKAVLLEGQAKMGDENQMAGVSQKTFGLNTVRLFFFKRV